MKHKIWAGIALLSIGIVVGYFILTSNSLMDVYLKQQNKSLKYNIKVTDENKKILENVEVKIRRSKITGGTLFNPKGTDNVETSKMATNPQIFDFTGYISGYLTFKKAGYYPEKVDISKNSQSASLSAPVQLNIVLRKKPKMPKEELFLGDFSLSYEKDGSEEPKMKGWKLMEKPKSENNEYHEDPNEKFYVSEDGWLPEAVSYKETKDVELYVVRDKKNKRKLWLVSNRQDTGFFPVLNAKDMTFLAMAPMKGYKQSIALEIPKGNDSDPSYFFYVKLHGKFYGKMVICPSLIDDTLTEDYSKDGGPPFINYWLDIECYLNPSGSKNVATQDE